MKKQLLLSIILICFTFYLQSQTLKERHIVTSGSVPGSIGSMVVADFNNDNIDDIIVGDHSHGDFYFLEGKGDMQFELLKKLDLIYHDLREIKSADIDNDGLIDLVLSTEYNGRISWYRNLGNFHFTFGSFFESKTDLRYSIISFLLTDLNGDDVTDIVSCRYKDYNSVLGYQINKGNGDFYSIVHITDTLNINNFYSIDIDNDSFNDIIFNTEDFGTVYVSKNDGEGNFTNFQTIYDSNTDGIYDFISYDYDLDDDIDILGFTKDFSMKILLNEDNDFTNIININNDSTFYPCDFLLIDINNDGHKDIMNCISEFLIYDNDSSFIYKKNYDSIYFHSGKIICDLDNNGDEDVIYEKVFGNIKCFPNVSFSNSSDIINLTSLAYRPTYVDYQNITNDEHPDICITDYGNYNLFFKNDGNNHFKDTLIIPELHNYPQEVAYFDFNKDGFADIVSYSDYKDSYNNDSTHFKFAKNNGNNTFTQINVDGFQSQNRAYAQYFDYDEDNELEAVLMNNYSQQELLDTLFFVDLQSDFTINITDTVTINNLDGYSRIHFSDINNDNFNDLIICNYDHLSLSYYNSGGFDNSFDTIIKSKKKIYDFAFGHIDNNPLKDLVYIKFDSVIIKRNFDGNSFQNTKIIYINNFPSFVFMEDLNKDSIDEIIYLAKDTIGIISFHDDFTYNKDEYYYANWAYSRSTSNPFVFKDIDFDGDKDLLCVDMSWADISWFENSYIDTIDYNMFPENNASWTVQNLNNVNGVQQSWTSIFKTESDTIIDGNNYVNIFEYRLKPENFDTIRSLYCSVRQDLIKKQVYVIRHYLNESSEKLLMDFKAKAGDTLNLSAYNLTSEKALTESFILDSINTIELNNGQSRNIQYLSNHNDIAPMNLQIIEGIGSLANPFGYSENISNKSLMSDDCCPKYLLCHEYNNEQIYILNESDDCESLKIWTGVGEQEISNISLFPNPTSNTIRITTSDSQKIISYQIYNIDAYLIDNFVFTNSSKSKTIDCSKFENAVYFIRVNTENNTYVLKFIVKN